MALSLDRVKLLEAPSGSHLTHPVEQNKVAYFFIVQSFLPLLLPAILPGGNPSLGPRKLVMLSHS